MSRPPSPAGRCSSDRGQALTGRFHCCRRFCLCRCSLLNSQGSTVPGPGWDEGKNPRSLSSYNSRSHLQGSPGDQICPIGNSTPLSSREQPVVGVGSRQVKQHCPGPSNHSSRGHSSSGHGVKEHSTSPFWQTQVVQSSPPPLNTAPSVYHRPWK